jgi:hypothetical protein
MIRELIVTAILVVIIANREVPKEPELKQMVDPPPPTHYRLV